MNLNSVRGIVPLPGKCELLHLRGCSYIELSRAGGFPVALQSNSPAVKGSNCLWSLTLRTRSVLLQRIYCPQFVMVITNPLFFCTTNDTPHICRCHLCPAFHVFNPSPAPALPPCRGSDKGWQDEVMFAGLYCSWADFSSLISHPCGGKLNIATHASSFS